MKLKKTRILKNIKQRFRYMYMVAVKSFPMLFVSINIVWGANPLQPLRLYKKYDPQ